MARKKSRKKKKSKKSTKSAKKAAPRPPPPPKPAPPPPPPAAPTPATKEEKKPKAATGQEPKVTVEYIPVRPPQPPITINKIRETSPCGPRPPCVPCGMRSATALAPPRCSCHMHPMMMPSPYPSCSPSPMIPLTPLLLPQQAPSIQNVPAPDTKPIINIIVNKSEDDDERSERSCPRVKRSYSSDILQTVLSTQSDYNTGRIRQLTQNIVMASENANMARMRLAGSQRPSVRRVQSAEGKIWTLLDLESQLADELARYRRSGRIRDPNFLDNLERTEQRLRTLVQNERMAANQMRLQYERAQRSPPCGGLFNQFASALRFFSGNDCTTLYHYPTGPEMIRISTESPTTTTATPTSTPATTPATTTVTAPPKKTPTKSKKKKKKKKSKKKKKKKSKKKKKRKRKKKKK